MVRLAAGDIAVHEQHPAVGAARDQQLQLRDEVDLVDPAAVQFLGPDDLQPLPTGSLAGVPLRFTRGSPQRVERPAGGAGLYPIVTSQCISTTLYQFSYHIQ